MENKKPHRVNEKYSELDDYAMRIMEEVSINAFMHYSSNIEKLYNVNLKYTISVDSGDNKKKDVVLTHQEVGAGYSFLPILFTTNIQERYNSLFPNSEYPIGVNIQKGASTFGSIPTIKTLKHFDVLLYLIDFEIEKFVSSQFVKSVAPFINSDLVYDLNNKKLENILFDSIKKYDLSEKDIKIDLTELYKYYLKIVNSSLRDEIYIDETSNDEFFESNMIQPTLIDIREYISRLDRPNKVNKIRVDKENSELNNFKKPEYPSSMLLKLYQENEEQQSRININTGGNLTNGSYSF